MKRFQSSRSALCGFYEVVRSSFLTIAKNFGSVAVCLAFSTVAEAQNYWPPENMPYYNGANPRPDLLPRGLYNAWVPYRAAYNRPTFLGGLAAHVIEPTSQEAMSWKENREKGLYRTHCPTPVKNYYYPKPWEVLETDARPAVAKLDNEFSTEEAKD